MINRYKHSKISKIWEDKHRFSLWLDIEKTYLKVLEDEKEIKSVKSLLKNLKINTDRIYEIEKTTKHETTAFINTILEQEPLLETVFHRGITSSDIIDTAFSMQLRDAGKIILQELYLLIDTVKRKALSFKDIVSVSRTHGIHAEPSSFGLKFLFFYEELKRVEQDFTQQIENSSICMLSGAVGTYSLIKPKYEKKIAKLLGLKTTGVTSQIIPRDIYARYFQSLAVLVSVLERMAVEIRHLQQTEVSELTEGFTEGQTGSSVMPHKKNPISLENITGLSRMVRSFAVPSMENIVLWGERDISHSSAERLIAPDATGLSAYLIKRMSGVINKLALNKKNIKSNLEKTKGMIFSSSVLNELVKNNVNRQKAYEITQKASLKVYNSEEKTFYDAIKKELIMNNIKIDLDNLFNYKNLLKNVDLIYKRVLK